MFFVGTFELTIDSKNRLSVPYAIRRKLNEDRDGHGFYVMPGSRRGTVAIYPEKYFEGMRPVPPAERLSPTASEWRQFEYSQASLLDPDSQGRLTLPKRLLDRVGIDKEVALIGVQDHLELWDRQAFNAFEDSKWDVFEEQRAEAMQELGAYAVGQAPASSGSPPADAG